MSETTKMQGTVLTKSIRLWSDRQSRKDTVFHDLFGTEENKDNALSLYNALSGKDYTDPDLLELAFIDDVLYLSVPGDVAFLIDLAVLLWDSRAKHNPNAPLRALTHFSKLFTCLIERQDRTIRGNSRIEIPTVRYITLFVGKGELPEKEVLRLSDSFADGPGDFEVKVNFLNINAGHNIYIMRRCRVLEDYAYFIKLVQDYAASEGLDDALTTAMSQCINEGVLADYLQHNWSQITHTVLSEYAEAKTMRQLREEAIREGYDIGYDTGYDTGYDKGRNDGYDKGHSDGYDEGRDQGAGEERQSILARIRDKIANGSMTVQDAYDLGFTKQEV